MRLRQKKDNLLHGGSKWSRPDKMTAQTSATSGTQVQIETTPAPIPVPEPHVALLVHGLKPPGKLNTSGNLAENWKCYKQVWDNYSLISGLNSRTDKYKVAFLLHCIGPEGLKIYNGFQFENDTDRKILSCVLEKFEEFTLGQTNETYERYVFNSRNQEIQESIDGYVTVLRNLAKSCNFCECMRDTLIRDRIVLGINNNALRKKLLQQVRKLMLNQCINICRSTEATTSQMQAFSGVDSVYRVRDGLRHVNKSLTKRKNDRNVLNNSRGNPHKKCLFCV